METKHGSERHSRRIENRKKKVHRKKIHRVGYKRDDDFNPHELINAYNSGDKSAPFFIEEDATV